MKWLTRFDDWRDRNLPRILWPVVMIPLGCCIIAVLIVYGAVVAVIWLTVPKRILEASKFWRWLSEEEKHNV